MSRIFVFNQLRQLLLTLPPNNEEISVLVKFANRYNKINGLTFFYRNGENINFYYNIEPTVIYTDNIYNIIQYLMDILYTIRLIAINRPSNRNTGRILSRKIYP